MTDCSVIKRNGDEVPYDEDRIRNAIRRAFLSVNPDNVTVDVNIDKCMQHIGFIHIDGSITVEKIQDSVELSLMGCGFPLVAKSFILYRQKRSDARLTSVPSDVTSMFSDSKQHFQDALSEFVYYRSYSRWLQDKLRRETWPETVHRYISYMRTKMGVVFSDPEYNTMESAILNQEVMPSMRLLWASGEMIDRDNAAAYNCAYTTISRVEDFAEVAYISMCGSGMGFEASKNSVSKLPDISERTGVTQSYQIPDSKEGWADAITMGMKAWFNGDDITFDYSLIRPAGARLKTMGGRSSGLAPLKELLNYAREVVLSNSGGRLSTINVHDIVCKIGEIVVSGGVRRTALISLSDIDDYDIRDCKTGQFYLTHMHRSFSNNSAIYNKKPTSAEFLTEWLALVKSGSGERGIFNRGGIVSQAPDRRKKILRDNIDTTGVNPCSEIILLSKQQCNLTEVIARHYDTEDSLASKVRIASMLGTYQSTLTDFRYLAPEWKLNAERERLLGVSITGQWDCGISRSPETLRKLRDIAVTTNVEYARKIGVNASTCVTCVKPSGSVSSLTNSSAGMHARYAPYYIRRVRISATDSLFKLIRDQGFKYCPEVGQEVDACNTYVIEFPIKSPDGSVFQGDLSALEQLEHWKVVKENYTEHNPSVTIMISEHEWISVANWVYENWDIVGGLAFLPKSDHNYKLAPYEEIDEDTYNMMSANMVDIDYSKLMLYETTDETSGAKEVACAGGSCDIL